jgi:hypothetical protein
MAEEAEQGGLNEEISHGKIEQSIRRTKGARTW